MHRSLILVVLAAPLLMAPGFGSCDGPPKAPDLRPNAENQYHEIGQAQLVGSVSRAEPLATVTGRIIISAVDDVGSLDGIFRIHGTTGGTPPACETMPECDADRVGSRICRGTGECWTCRPEDDPCLASISRVPLDITFIVDGVRQTTPLFAGWVDVVGRVSSFKLRDPLKAHCETGTGPCDVPFTIEIEVADPDVLEELGAGALDLTVVAEARCSFCRHTHEAYDGSLIIDE